MEYLVFVLSAVAIFSTSRLIYMLDISVVRASSFLVVFAGMSLSVIENFIDLDTTLYLKIIFGASFISMTTFKPQKRSFWFVATILYTLAFIFLLPILPHSAGALGLCAFISVYTSKLISSFSNLKTTPTNL